MSVSLCFALLRKKYIPSQLSFSSRYPSYFLLSRYHGLSGLTLMLAVSVRTLIMYFLRRNATRDEMEMKFHLTGTPYLISQLSRQLTVNLAFTRDFVTCVLP